ncbi:MAG: multiheme c-type cytochrome [Rhodospirillaceae bacterium]
MTVRERLRAYALLALLAAAPAGAGELPLNMPHKSLGVASCSSSLCHGGVEPWKESGVLQNEYLTWSRSDKHARAYTILLEERSQEIGRRLGLKERPEHSAVCLDCHAHNVPLNRRGPQFVMSDGVTCEACHGPAERWVRSHVEKGATHAANVANGMFPTASHVERARLCLSCHFGDTQRFVTHKMMAAGHPRMSFELDTFTHIQPAHYRADGAAARERRLWDGVRIWAIGQAIAASSLLDIFNDPKRGRDGLFPELVLFDCHACHNVMSGKRASGMRLGVGPGIVRLNDASLLMLKQIVRRVSPADESAYAAQVTRVHKAIASGNDAHDQARVLRGQIAALQQKIAAYSFAAEDLRGIMRGLIDDGLGGEYTDYQGAEQAVMALQSVADFMARRGLIKASSIAAPMKTLLAAAANDEKYRAADFARALQALKARLDTEVAK